MTVPFATEVVNRFGTLAEEFNMTCASSSEWRVRFESADAFLTVNFDNGRSYELGVEIGRRQQVPERPFSLAEVLRLRRSPEAQAIDGMMVREASRLSAALSQLANLTSLHAADLLQGNEFSYAQLAKQRERESDAYALEAQLRAARFRSSAAWTRHDYQSVVDALEPLNAHLSPAERKRLEFARKHL